MRCTGKRINSKVENKWKAIEFGGVSWR
jgi:hypothetical protein